MRRGYLIRSQLRAMSLETTGAVNVGGDLNVLDSYWDDLSFPLTPTHKGANDKPDYDYTNLGFLMPQNDATEILYINSQMLHSFKEGSAFWPHVHWLQTADKTPVFKLAYKFYNAGEAPTADFAIYEMSTKVFTYTSGTLAQISRGAAALTIPSLKISFMMKMKVYREDNVSGGDVLVDQFDIHRQIDALGSREEYVK
jgi:hypothetical protein